MNKYLIFSLLLFVFLANSCANGQTQNTKVLYNAADFAAKIKELAQVPVIDVRTPGEFAKGHLAKAQNVDWNSGANFEQQLAKFDKKQPIFIYCLSGGRSAAAAKKMQALGFEQIYELEGGIMRWRAANLPETTENANASQGMSRAQFDALLDTDKVVLIDFYADWCAPCKKMKPYLEEIGKEMGDKVTVIRINADDNQALCKELGIDGLPVLQVYKHKAQTWKYTGFIEKAEVVKQL